MAFAPLQGIRVLDLSRYLPGPYLTRILCDLGAEVIKVEGLGGEGLRHAPPRRDGMGVAFASLNAGKLSVALDSKAPEGRAVLQALARRVDVLVESFRPGVLARMGLEIAALRTSNPGLIVCSLSGYGQTGPHRDVAGHDLNYLARSGLLSLFAGPGVPGVQIGDLGGGAQPAAIGILAALLDRQGTGEGRHLDISLSRGALSWGTVALTAATEGADDTGGKGLLTGGAASYRCYETADGRHLAVGALEPRFFRIFLEAIGLADLPASSLATGDEAERAAAAIATVLKGRTLAAWTEVFAGLDACVEPVLLPEEALSLPEHADVVQQVDGYTVLRTDVGAASDLIPLTGPRALGADGRHVCEALDLDPALVGAAVAAGALLLESE